jgi:hypothetical protein
MDSKKYKKAVRSDGSVVYYDYYGNTYFNNGRMKTKAGKMKDYDYTRLK